MLQERDRHRAHCNKTPRTLWQKGEPPFWTVAYNCHFSGVTMCLRNGEGDNFHLTCLLPDPLHSVERVYTLRECRALVFCNVKSRGEERNYSPLRKVQGPTLPRSWQEESAPVFATALHDYTFALRAHHRIIYPSFSSTVQPSVRTDHLQATGEPLQMNVNCSQAAAFSSGNLFV